MSNVFPKMSFLRNGYAPEHVDVFFEDVRRAYEGGVPTERFSFEQVRQATFPLKRGGYRMDAVDVVVNRLEVVFVQHDRLDHVAVDGEVAWLERITDRATTLCDRLLCPRGERFVHPQGGRGYDVVAVDDLLNRLTAYFDEGRFLSADEIRTAVFKLAREKKRHLEGLADIYLGRVVGILLAVE